MSDPIPLPGTGKLVWVCGCGCMTFCLHDDGVARCYECEEPTSADGLGWTPVAAVTVPPDEARAVAAGKGDFSKRRMQAMAQEEDIDFLVVHRANADRLWWWAGVVNPEGLRAAVRTLQEAVDRDYPPSVE